MNKFLFILFIFFFANSINAQTNITGNVTDADSGEPLIGAHIFLANTQSGTTTDENGNFELTKIKNGAAELTVQYIGYETWSRKIIIHEKPLNDISIKLKPFSQNLGTIDITAKATNKRKRYLNRFIKAFIGTSPLAKKCNLLNPAVLLFEESKNILTATASDLLKIENKGTGYLIYFSLEKFELKGSEATYAGKPFFQELNTDSETEKAKWKKERKKAYFGSRKHFMQSLAHNELKKQGYEIRLGEMDTQGQFISKGFSSEKKIMAKGFSEYDRTLTINNFLQVIYKNEKGNSISENTGGISLGRDHETSQGNSSSSNKHQVSYLYALNPQVQFFTDGRLAKPHLLKEYGHFGTERIAELMPTDFTAEEPVEKEPQVSINGFNLDNASINLKEIKKGGPPRDGIPSIDNPVFISADYIKNLNPDDSILGVVYNGITKAYPIKILNWHEVVNDQFGAEKIAITYCPLCGSGMAFNTNKIGGLGVSGLLYNSDVLLYDRATESLWSQIMGEAIAGKKIGERLEYITTTYTTWGQWKKQFPNTLVLSQNTGFNKNYNKTAYEGYEGTEKLLFPVSNKNKTLKNKERIIGIEINGQFKAYSFSKRKKQNNIVKDIFNNKKITIEFNKNSDSGVVKIDGAIYPSVSMYWFAWYAFHPETEIF